MSKKPRTDISIVVSASCLLLLIFAWLARLAAAQNPELQQKIGEIKQAVAANKQALAQYTWVETVTISLKGEQKKQEHFQVRTGADGKPQKTSLDPPDSGQESGGRLKKHVVEKKREEYKQYAAQIKELIQQYVPPEKDLIGNAYMEGNIMVGPHLDLPGQYRLVISNYLKQGDILTLVMDTTQKALVSLSIATYLTDSNDGVKVDVQFAGMPGGPNHVASETINGVSKELTIAIVNNNYQRL